MNISPPRRPNLLFRLCTLPILLAACALPLSAQEPDIASAFSEKYKEIWNADVQAKIDAAIETHRKADGSIALKDVPAGTEVSIVQESHDFLFGGNIFLFGDLKTPEGNKAYEDTFGDLFNAATVPFYWRTLEQEQGKPRFTADSSYEYRRPPTDPVVAFCESKGINMNAHAMIYGMRRWGHPTWMPEDRQEMEKIFESHIRQISERYRGRIQRWDVVNEPTDQANRGTMPDDYTYKSFQWAKKYLADESELNINDADLKWDMTLFHRYLEIVRNLLDRKTPIESVGIQMHIMNPALSRQLAEGKEILTPAQMQERFDLMADAGRPLYISEVTISAPDESEKGELIQAGLAKNLYRFWFSYPLMKGITWWNVVDGGAAPGEPSTSGLFTGDMKRKIAYGTLSQLIHEEWTTKLKVTTQSDNETVKFRGFAGRYRITWKDGSGKTQSLEYHLQK